MKNIALDHGGAVQLDAICMDGPLDLSTDGQILRDEVALHLCAFVYQNGQRPKLALDLAENLYCALAENFADDCHAATDSGSLVGCLLFPRVHPCRRWKLLSGGRPWFVLGVGFPNISRSLCCMWLSAQEFQV